MVPQRQGWECGEIGGVSIGALHQVGLVCLFVVPNARSEGFAHADADGYGDADNEKTDQDLDDDAVPFAEVG